MPGIEFFAFGGEFLVKRVGEREVHVVATEENMVADREAGELDIAAGFGDGDQREIAGATADIDHEDDVADLRSLRKSSPRASIQA